MTTIERSTWATKVGLARMLAGGVIMAFNIAMTIRGRERQEAPVGGASTIAVPAE